MKGKKNERAKNPKKGMGKEKRGIGKAEFRGPKGNP